jgi:tetratricopeptide (TPR) repeat protein
MVLVFATIATIAIPRNAHAQTMTLSVMEVLDQYDRRRELAIGALEGIEHIGTIEDALEAEGDAWVNALGPQEAPRRRLVAATFALEAARVAMDEEWLYGARLVEWGCAELRKQKTPLPAEVLWQRAALALIEGAYDFEFLTNPKDGSRKGPAHHLNHVKDRFPNDPSLVMARAFVATEHTILGVSNNLWDSGASEVPGETVARLTDALAVPSLAAEAHIRLAFLDLMANRFDTAATHLDAAETATTDPELRYLAALFRGWAWTRQKKPDDAIAAFRKAIEAVPDAQTATLALGAGLYANGEREEASAMVEHALTATDPTRVHDPWLLYGYGDFRRWPKLIAELREALK